MDAAGRAPSGSVRDVVVAGALAGFVLVVHLASPIRTSFDSRWAIHTAVSLAYRGDADLDEYEELLRVEENYAIEERAGRRYTRVPIGPSLLAVPIVVAYDVLARATSMPTSEDLIAAQRAVGLEVLVASLVVALSSGIVYLIGRARGLRRDHAAALAVVFAFCTSAWSTASRGLWQHGPSMLTGSSALYLMLLARRRDGYAALAALPLAFGVLIRPTNAIALVVFAGYVAVRHPRRLAAFVAAGTVVLATFCVMNLHSFGAVLPSYYLPSGQPIGVWSDLPTVLLGHLVSPNRGLLVFSPVLLFALVGIAEQLRRRSLDLLDGAVLSVLGAHLVAISCAGQWWAGHSFGPRFSTDVLPLLAYFMVPVFAAFAQWQPAARRSVAALFVVLAAWSFFAQLRAATTWEVWAWNGTPVSIDDRPEHAWDWADLQILRGLGSDRPGR